MFDTTSYNSVCRSRDSSLNYSFRFILSYFSIRSIVCKTFLQRIRKFANPFALVFSPVVNLICLSIFHCKVDPLARSLYLSIVTYRNPEKIKTINEPVAFNYNNASGCVLYLWREYDKIF